MLLKDMVQDQLTGLLVDPAWNEPPLMRPPTDIIDGIALRRPAPKLDDFGCVIYIDELTCGLLDPVRPLSARYEFSPATASHG